MTSEAANKHALIVTDQQVLLPSWRVLFDKPVTSVDALLKLLVWAKDRGLGPAGLPPQVWLTDGALVQLGWGPDDVPPGDEDDYSADELAAGRLKTDLLARLDERTTELLGPHLVPEEEDGWHLYAPGRDIGWRVHLSHTTGRTKWMVDLLLTGWALETKRAEHDRLGILGSEKAGTLIDYDTDIDTARELARRLSWHVDQLGVLPGATSARTGQVIIDRIFRERRTKIKAAKNAESRRRAGIVVDKALGIPPITDMSEANLEPPIDWARGWIDTEELDIADPIELITIDQQASYLASAGMVSLGYGDLNHLTGDAADQAARAELLPFGLWHGTLPATARIAGLPEQLPPPHPSMRADVDVTTWFTTETIRSLAAPIEDGGAGLEIDDLGLDECWITEHQGLVLKRWKEIIAGPYKAARGDRVLKGMVSDVYKGYLGRLAFEEDQPSLRHHHQPLWYAAIRAHARHRNRAKAMKIAAAHGIWPVKGLTDSWTYIASADAELADPEDKLGKFRVDVVDGEQRRRQLDNDMINALYAVDHDAALMKRTISTIFTGGDIDALLRGSVEGEQ